MKIKIPKSKVILLKNYVNSELYKVRKGSSYSGYWKEHAGRMNLKIENDCVEISGDSGFYIPEKIRSKFIRRLLKVISSPGIMIGKFFILYRRYFKDIRHLSWSDGFDAAMGNKPITDPDLSPYRINHLSLTRDFQDIIPTAKDVKKRYNKWSPYPISDHVIISYYFRIIILPHVERSQELCILEIGGGSGNLASILYKEYSPKMLIMVDLPESLVNAFVFLASIFPKSHFILPDLATDYINKYFTTGFTSEHGAIVFLTPWQVNCLPPNIIDLSINAHSFQEMTHEQICEYFSLIKRVSREGGLFFCANRVEKIPCEGNSYAVIQDEPPNRFYDYPWHRNNIKIIDEVSRLHRVCVADAIALRLERVVKDMNC